MIQDFGVQSKSRYQKKMSDTLKETAVSITTHCRCLFLTTKWFRGGAKTEVSKIIQATFSQIIAHLPFFHSKRFYHPEGHPQFFVFHRGLRCAKIYLDPSALKGWNVYVD